MKISKQEEESRKFRNHSEIFAHVAKIQISLCSENLVRMSPAQCFYFLFFIYFIIIKKN